MRPKVVVALVIAVAACTQTSTARAAELPAEIATRGARWIALPQEADIEVNYRVKDADRARELALTCVLAFAIQEPGRGGLDERIEPSRGGLIGVEFGRNFSHTEYQSGGKQGTVYTTMDTELTGAKGTLPLHCDEPRIVLQGVGRVLIYLHKKGQPEKPISNQVQLRVAADDESKKQLQQRYGPALEAAPVPATTPPPAAPAQPTQTPATDAPPPPAEQPRTSE